MVCYLSAKGQMPVVIIYYLWLFIKTPTITTDTIFDLIVFHKLQDKNGIIGYLDVVFTRVIFLPNDYYHVPSTLLLFHRLNLVSLMSEVKRQSNRRKALQNVRFR